MRWDGSGMMMTWFRSRSRIMPVDSSSPGMAMGWLTMLFSSGTLLCCALPILLVTVGLGAAVASLTAAFPPLVTLVAHKDWVFGVSAALLATAGYSVFRPGQTCPAEPALARVCQRARRLSTRLLRVSLAIWVVGFVMAYLALPIRIWLGY